MREWIKAFMLIKATERRAIMILSVLVLISSLVYFLLPSFVQPEKSKLIIAPQLEKQLQETNTDNNTKQTYSSKKSIYHLHAFDPNTISKEELIEMGIAPKLASTWTNYTSKGGKFYSKESLKKLYGMHEDLYNQLVPFIEIAPKQIIGSSAPIPIKQPIVKASVLIDINTADTNDLKKLPMIGSKRAQMIVKYRTSLGGFIALTQLKEVYSINDTVYQLLKDNIYIDKNFKPISRSINLNTESILVKHPYIRPVAKIIAAYKAAHGPIQNIDELRKVYGIDSQTLNKIEPYINFDLE
ncbi:MAG: helix-hairpin-helix domain-containing protein [Bacteroidota bacterium]